MSNNTFGYIPELPEEIREIFMWLCQDVASLQRKWDFYIRLYGNQESTELLSELACSSFQIIEEALRDDMTMAICRLSDPLQSHRKDNRSLKTLTTNKCVKRETVDQLLKEFIDACKPVQQLRNKRVGHNNLNTRIRPNENLLPGISRSQIDRIIETATKTLNVICQRFVDCELKFRPIHIGGAEDLIYWLKTAREYQEEKEQQPGGGTASCPA